jgi:hypothetical protein
MSYNASVELKEFGQDPMIKMLSAIARGVTQASYASYVRILFAFFY